MATVTKECFRAGDGAFKATITYDDVTLICSTVNYDLTAGIAKIKYTAGQIVTLPSGLGKTVPFAGSQLVGNNPLGQGFMWSPS